MASEDRDVLPSHVKPLNYNLSLFNLEFGGNWGYDGLLKIDTEVSQSTAEVVLNAKEIDIKSAEILGSDGRSISKMEKVSYEASSERATLKFDSELPPGSVVVAINYTGIMNDAMAGFYRARYKPTVTPEPSTAKDEEWHYMFATQFEACDARRAFPCFDEPNLKASFEFEIEIPEGQVAISNMPEKAVTKGSKSGLQKVSFEKTPKMSTYLAAWAVGDFEYVEDFTQKKYNGKNLPVRVYTTKGLKEQGRFALEHAHKTLDYFSEIFGIDYPLPKSDLLAVHEFAMGAMENWGLVTYRTTAVLYDEGKSDAKFKNRVAYVVAHELAHQWFGNLVTMDWWNEIWLNEGFATWVGWLAVDKFHPDWQVWSQFVTEAVQTAMQLDSLRASHPIEVPVRNALEIDQIFDAISYLKGSSVIRMLSNHLGQEVFLKGVGDYLKAHAYGNAKTNDLWAALSAASGQDVQAFMDPWIRKIGFPVVTVAEEPGQISIRQTRFLTSGDVKPEEDKTTWWIPLGLKTGSPEKTIQSALKVKEDIIRDVDDNFYKLNADQSGVYRTSYPPQRLLQLGRASDRLSTEDKIGLMGDASALAVSGEGTTAALLQLLEGFQKEQSYLVWVQVNSSLGRVRSVFSANKTISDGLKKFALKLVSPAAEAIGWEFKDEDDYLTGQKRKLLLGMAAGAGHKKIIAEGQDRFKKWQSGDQKAIHQNLRSVVYNLAIANGGQEEFLAVKTQYKEDKSVDGKEICIQAMGRAKEGEFANNLLNFTTSAEVPVQDSHGGIVAIAANNDTKIVGWEYTKSQWDRIVKRIGASKIAMDRWVRMGLVHYSDHKIADDIRDFFKDKDSAGFGRGLVIVDDTIKSNANYREREEAKLEEWLQAHGYA